MGRITIFSADGCPHSRRTTTALKARNLPYVVISLTQHPEKRADMIALSHRLSTPQVFFNTRHVGGADETIAMLQEWDNDTRYSSSYEKFLKEIKSMYDPANPRFEIPVKKEEPRGRQQQRKGSANPASSSDGNGPTSLYEEDDEADLIHLQLPQRPKSALSVLEMTETLKQILPSQQELSRRLTVYRNVFTGYQATTALQEHYQFESSETTAGAWELFQQLLQKGLVVQASSLATPATERSQDQLKKVLFRLQCDSEPLVLNSFRLHKSSAVLTNQTSPGQLLQDLFHLMSRLQEDIVTDEGKIDYASGQKHALYPIFEEASCALQKVDLGQMKSNEEKIAFGINLYNLMIKYAFIKVGAGNSDYNRLIFFNKVSFRVGPHVYTMQDWENGILRQNRKAPYAVSTQFVDNNKKKDPRLQYMVDPVEPRIHFALNCGAQSCPPVNYYTAEDLDRELKLAAAAFCESDANVEIKAEKQELHISKIFAWYKQDFVQNSKEYPEKLSKYMLGLKKNSLERLIDDTARGNNGGTIKIVYQPYDWSTGARKIDTFNFKKFQTQQRSVVKSVFSSSSPGAEETGKLPNKTTSQNAFLDTSDKSNSTTTTTEIPTESMEQFHS